MYGQPESDTALYAQTSGTTNSSSLTAMQGLSLTIPEGVGTTAIITLNVPNPYATGNDIPGGMFGVTVNGKVSPVVASFTYNDTPSSFGRIPTTLVVGIPLGNTAQTIQAVWAGVRGSTVIIDSPASLTRSLLKADPDQQRALARAPGMDVT